VFRGGSAVEAPRTGAKGFSAGLPPVSGTEFFFPSAETRQTLLLIIYYSDSVNAQKNIES